MDNSQLNYQTNASSSIWYVLATIAGEPKGAHEANQLTAMNRHYWNGLMADRVAVYGGSYQMTLKREIPFPTLTPDDHNAIRQALDSRGFSGIPVPRRDEAIDFCGVVFPQFTSFMGFVFGGETKFDRAIFPGGIHLFNEITYAGNVTFDDCQFLGELASMKSETAGLFSFSGAKFHGLAIFSQCKFLTAAKFEDAHFLGDALFNGSTFAIQTNFSRAVFSGGVDFRSVIFEGPTDFQHTKFQAQVPSFFEATLHEYTQWHGSEWPDVSGAGDDARDQVQRYQRLSRLMGGLEKYDDQHFFFRRELRALRRAEGWTIVGTMNLAYELICDYGYGLLRILSIWITHIVLGAVALWGSKIAHASAGGFQLRTALDMINDLPDAFKISFGNAHGLLELNQNVFQDTVKAWEKNPGFDVIAAIQLVLGVIILFFLLLTIRNRFRMR